MRACATPPFLPARRVVQRVNLWVGSAGTVARMHYDSSPNWFLQVSTPLCPLVQNVCGVGCGVVDGGVSGDVCVCLCVGEG